jgi:hypothetical protein
LMGLQDVMNFCCTHLPSIVQGVKGVGKRMLTSRTLEALDSFRCCAMLVNMVMVAEGSFHKGFSYLSLSLE